MELDAEIEQIDCDVKAEVIAANFVENANVPLDKISINNRSNRERRYRKDILKVEYRETKLGNEEVLNIDVTRRGIYDVMPQGFFHVPQGDKQKKDTERAIKQIKLNREEEEAVRLFFLPIERELNRIRVTLELIERQTVIGIADSYQDDLFAELFPVIMEVDEVHRPAMIQILPVVHKFRGSGEAIAMLMEFLFGMPAKLKSINQYTIVPNFDKLNTIGKVFIGENFILGNQIPDYSPSVEIEVGPMNKTDALKFLPGATFDKLMTFIKKYLIPFDSEIFLSYLFHENEKGLYLSSTDTQNIIGLNTYL